MGWDECPLLYCDRPGCKEQVHAEAWFKLPAGWTEVGREQFCPSHSEGSGESIKAGRGPGFGGSPPGGV